MFGRLIGFWAAEIFSSNCSNCRSGQFLVSDVGPDHFLVPANGRDKVPARPEFVPRKFRILRSTFCAIHIELFPFMYPMICATDINI
jgi:hypothetical protein